MSTSFADLGVSAEAVRSLRARGITFPFPIQAQAIPPALAGEDVCGRAPTGSGKTIAFGLPIAARVERAGPGRPRALILAPTRELAAQIQAEMTLLMGSDRRRRVAAFYGGVGFGSQLDALRRGVDVAVACPGRLADLVRRGAVSLSDVAMVVIDEADRMADMGFLPEVKRILDQVRADRQTLLFSATLDGDVDVLVRRYQQSPVKISVGADSASVGSATHHWVDTPREERVAMAAHYVKTHGSSVVFCRTKHATDRVAKQLVAAGVKAVPIHGGRSQAQRDRALAAFSSGRAEALVATDVAARGLHVDDVRCVIHFDIAGTDKDYLHRSGRTGRAGADGVVISLVTPTDVAAVRTLQKALKHPLSSQSESPDRDKIAAGSGSRSPGSPRRNRDALSGAPHRRPEPGAAAKATRSGRPAGNPSAPRPKAAWATTGGRRAARSSRRGRPAA